MTTFESFHAITTLLHRYAECIDLADFDGLATLFDQAILTNEGFPGEVRGGAAIAAMYRQFNKVHADGTLRTRHVTTNPIVSADEADATATCRSYFVVFQATDLVPLQPIVSGRYHDRFVCDRGTWRFAQRHILMEATGNVADHLLIDPAGMRGR